MDQNTTQDIYLNQVKKISCPQTYVNSELVSHCWEVLWAHLHHLWRIIWHILWDAWIPQKLVTPSSFISWKTHFVMLAGNGLHHSLYWSIHTKDESKSDQTRNRVCFHLWCELTLVLWCHSIVWGLFSWKKKLMEWEVSWNSSYKLKQNVLR